MAGVAAGGGNEGWMLGSSGCPVMMMLYPAANAMPQTRSILSSLRWLTEILFPAVSVPLAM